MRLTFSNRIILSVVIIQVVMLSFLVYRNIELISKSYSELLTYHSIEQSELLATALSTGLMAYDYAMIDDVVMMLKENHDLVYIMVYDRDGALLSSIGNTDNHAHPGLHSFDYQTLKNIESSQQSQVMTGLWGNVFNIDRSIVVSGQHVGAMHVGYSTHSLDEISVALQKQNIVIAVITMFFMVLATVVISFILTVKLRKLKEGVNAIESGQLTHKIEMDSNDEVGDLAHAFNNMTEHLNKTQDELEKEHGQLQQQTERIHTLLNSVDAVIWESDSTLSMFKFVSREAEQLLGLPLDDWNVEGFILSRVASEDRKALVSTIESLEVVNKQVSVDLRLIHQNGKLIWSRIIASATSTKDGDKVVRGLIIDINREKLRDEQMIFLAEHDALTGLINRTQFQKRLKENIVYSKRYKYTNALLFIDVDKFKYINDTYGHYIGDQYLIEVVKRISNTLRETDVFGRQGGDEFAIILPHASEDEAMVVSENLLSALNDREWSYEGKKLHISVSIGITIFDGTNNSPEKLLAQADSAMYRAKELGRNCLHLYNDSDGQLERMQKKIHWENIIQDALRNDRFVLHFQPIVEINSGRVSHHEALLRIIKANNEIIYPGAFISSAERFGLMDKIDKWVFERVVKLISESIVKGESRTIAVNLSGLHIASSNFQRWIRKLFSDNPGVAEHIIIEVTETAAVENLATANDFIRQLSLLGCHFALDDFGVGFSSFHYIKNLDVKYIKIDGSFVKNLHVTDSDRVFVKATVDIARSLNIYTIAEFVENGEILDILHEIGADYAQGFYLGKPSPEFIECNNE